MISAPVIQHPDKPDEPAYKVQILQPAPKPLPTSAAASSANTPAASKLGTPRSEPTPVERILTVSEVATIFLKSLLQSAEDFLGKKIEGAVITTPSWFDDAQRAGLIKAAEDAGIKVLQLLEDVAAAAVQTTTTPTSPELPHDRTQLIVDVGSSSLSLALLSIRQGLAYSLATSNEAGVGADAIDSKLIKFFAKEFTKKNKIPLSVSPSTEPADKRAEAKLRLAIEHTKRTISASPGAATCAVESLKDGYDFTGTINRMRFDMEAREVYDKVGKAAKALIESAGLDLYDVDEIIYVGGTGCLPGLDESLLGLGFNENTIITPFSAGTAVGGGAADPTTILSKGAVLQARLLTEIAGEEDLLKAFEKGSELSVKTTAKTVGILFPEEGAEDLGGQWVPVVLKETPLPARRIYSLDVDLGEGSADGKKVGFEVWEVKEHIKVELVKTPALLDDDGNEIKDDDDDDEEEESEVKEKTVEKENQLASIVVPVKDAKKEKGRWKTKIGVQFLITAGGDLEVSAWEIGKTGNGEKVVVSVSPS